MDTQEQSLILKGKRTKRQRPQSPIPFSVAPPLSPHDYTNLDVPDNDEDDADNHNFIVNGVSSASSSSNNVMLSAAMDEEDQDIAHCLILLAQSHPLSTSTPQHQQHQRFMNPNSNETNNNNGLRFSSRRFLETSSCHNGTNSGGKAGYYVYQCKTCDRTFPSFQALGGHRASHKKPKALHSDHHHHPLKKTLYNDAVSLRLYNDVTSTTPNNSNHRGAAIYGAKVSHKVHECGICGAEFTSGQALGGHMRRHRGAVVAAAVAATATTNTALSLSPMSFDQLDGQDLPAKRPRITAAVSLDLDLNLPAPEDENRVNGLGFASKQEQETDQQQQREQKSLVLSSPTLVDCHY